MSAELPQHMYLLVRLNSSSVISHSYRRCTEKIGDIARIVLFILIVPYFGWFGVSLISGSLDQSYTPPGNAEDPIMQFTQARPMDAVFFSVIEFTLVVAFYILFGAQPDQPMDVKRVMRETFRLRTLGKCFITMVLVVILVLVGLLMCCAPGFYLLIMLSLSGVVAVLNRDLNPLDCLSRSYTLMKHCFCSGCCLVVIAPTVAGLACSIAIGGISLLLLSATGIASTVGGKVLASILVQIGMGLTVTPFKAALLVTMYETLTKLESHVAMQDEEYGETQQPQYDPRPTAHPLPGQAVLVSHPNQFYPQPTTAIHNTNPPAHFYGNNTVVACTAADMAQQEPSAPPFPQPGIPVAFSPGPAYQYPQ